VHDTSVDDLAGQLYKDHLRVLRAGGSYDFVDQFDAVNKFEGALSQGFSWDTGGTDIPSRADGQTNFFKGTAQASRLQTIKGPFDFYIAASGQLSANSLLIGEQFGIGGENFGSAYDPSEITGDSGADARAEIRYNRSGDLALIPYYQLYGFYDIGKVWNRDTPEGTPPGESLADTGLGLRFNAAQPLSGGVEVAAPLTRVVAADGTGSSGYRPRVFFNLAYRF
jgi:hemolysin activation/secretion protein